jgi:hypothetical protein
MRVDRLEHPRCFKPIRFQITAESLEELVLLRALFNHGNHQQLQKILPEPQWKKLKMMLWQLKLMVKDD